MGGRDAGRTERETRLMLSALDLARRIEAGELTPRAVVELCAEAIAKHETEVGAFTVLDLDAARRAAEAPGLVQKPLRGLPVGVKDIFDTVDFPTEHGSPIYAGHRPKADAALVALIRRAGGIVPGKTVTTEFASFQPAGTRNPHNLAHTPGGSSSGSAAAVAAGMLPIAIGSQTGGSVIRPAAYCGTAGYKPSFRLFPTVGMKCFAWSLDTAGLFAASVADVAFAAAAITARDLRVDREPPPPPRIALVRTPQWAEASAEMQAAVEHAARIAEAAGARIKDVDLPPIFADAFAAHATVQDCEAARALAGEFDRYRERFGPMLREQLDQAAAITPEAYDEARRTARRARRTFAELMADFDVILTPSAPGAAPHGLASTGKATFNRLWTLLGPPCVNVAGIADSAGLPLGVQVVGRFARDGIALRGALFLEQALARAHT
jgi:Asp-tRNA(Asn)/Glu-tRNA(Gln) amidotransferase A subunit family amidase